MDSIASTKSLQNYLSPRDPYLGMVLDGALLEEKLGQGGMGAVYRARHVTLDKLVAIKILPPEFTQNPQSVDRFLREARSAAKLEHPNIVQVFNAGQQHSTYFISMQYVAGESLQKLIHRLQKIPVSQTLWVMKAAIQGLAFAHQNSIIHRDIKPDNIMITSQGEVKVVDFGLARSSESGNTLSTPGQILGTPYFMSPEQCNGEVVDYRSDIYSLGITFYYMLSGTRPYDGNKPVYILMQHVNKDPVKTLDPVALNLPKKLCALVKKMMEKQLSHRYQNLEETLKDLEEICQQIPPSPLLSSAPLISASKNAETPSNESGGTSSYHIAPPQVQAAPPQGQHPINKNSSQTQDANDFMAIPTQNYSQPAFFSLDEPLSMANQSPTASALFPSEKKSSSTSRASSNTPSQGYSANNVPTMNMPPAEMTTTSQLKRPQVSQTSQSYSTPRKKPGGRGSGILFVFVSFFLMAGIIVGMVYLKKYLTEQAYQKAKDSTSQAIEKLKQEEPIDFLAIQQLYRGLQEQYPQSEIWCRTQLTQLEKEKKDSLKKQIEGEEAELRQQDNVDYAQLRLLYENSSGEASYVAWCTSRVQELYKEELDVCLNKKSFDQIALILASPSLQTKHKEIYQTFSTKLREGLIDYYTSEGKEGFLKQIRGQEIYFATLYRNLWALDGEDFRQLRFKLDNGIEWIFADILAKSDYPLFLNVFAICCDIPDLPSSSFSMVLDTFWNQFSEHCLAFIEQKANREEIELLNQSLKMLKEFDARNHPTSVYFKRLDEYLESQYRGMVIESQKKILLKEQLEKTYFRYAFTRAWNALGGKNVDADPDSLPGKEPLQEMFLEKRPNLPNLPNPEIIQKAGELDQEIQKTFQEAKNLKETYGHTKEWRKKFGDAFMHNNRLMNLQERIFQLKAEGLPSPGVDFLLQKIETIRQMVPPPSNDSGDREQKHPSKDRRK